MLLRLHPADLLFDFGGFKLGDVGVRVDGERATVSGVLTTRRDRARRLSTNLARSNTHDYLAACLPNPYRLYVRCRGKHEDQHLTQRGRPAHY